MMRKAVSFRTLRDTFQVSLSSISLIVDECLDAFNSPEFYNIWVRQPTPSTIPRNHDQYTNAKYAPLTSHCLGAIDGTHIPCIPPSLHAKAFRNRKGYLSLNVLAAVTLEEYFCYVYAGWEGSAHDTRIYQNALETGGFVIPDGYYYLADAGYTDMKKLVVPYRATRYHPKEWGHERPTTKKELFNLRHSSTRNAIERAFGILKRKSRVLTTGCALDISKQIKVVYACCALYNFMKSRGETLTGDNNPTVAGQLATIEDEAAAGQDSDEEMESEEDDNGARPGGDRIHRVNARDSYALESGEARRERVSRAMWRQYIDYNRGRAQ